MAMFGRRYDTVPPVKEVKNQHFAFCLTTVSISVQHIQRQRKHSYRFTSPRERMLRQFSVRFLFLAHIVRTAVREPVREGT